MISPIQITLKKHSDSLSVKEMVTKYGQQTRLAGRFKDIYSVQNNLKVNRDAIFTRSCHFDKTLYLYFSKGYSHQLGTLG